MQFIIFNKAEYVCYKTYVLMLSIIRKLGVLVIILQDGVRVVPLLHGNGDADNRADSIVPLFGKRPKV
jgi:hypothetical protein